MTKYRVVIRTTAARRDAAPAVLLAKLLERMGCRVMVTSTRDFAKSLIHWKPHVAVINSPNRGPETAKLAPQSRIVFFDAEGFLPSGFTLTELWERNPENLAALDLVLVWGRKVLEQCAERVPKDELSKFHVVGNPKLDFVRYLPEKLKKTKGNKSLGVIGRFSTINQYEGVPIVRTLPNPGNIDRIINECRSFNGLYYAIEAILEKTDYKISIRPHPNEQIESYTQYVIPRFGKEHEHRFEIDSSIDFVQWAVRQDALISPTSTSFLEAYLLRIPVINVDKIAGTNEFYQAYATVSAEWQGGGICPASLEELTAVLNRGVPAPGRNHAIEKQLAEYCDWQSGGSASLRAAQQIIALLETATFPRRLHRPYWLVDLRDEVSFRRYSRRNPLHHNFSYRRGFHEIPAHFDAMVDRIMADDRLGAPSGSSPPLTREEAAAAAG